MNKVILSFQLIFALKGCLFSQTTFNNTYDFSMGIEGAYSITTVNDGYILVGNGWGNEIGAFFDFKIKYTKLDLDGNILWQNFIGDTAINFFIYPKSTLLSQDGNVIFCGSKQTATISEAHLVKVNSSTGDTIFYSNFNYDDEMYGLQVQELTDGSIIILGYDSNDSFAYLLIKTTAAGEFIWDKRYGSTSEGYPTDFNVVDDTLYIVNGNYLCSPEGYHIRTIDSSGAVISNDYFNDDCVANGLKSSQGGFIGGGAYYPVPPYQTFCYRTDLNGNVLWHYETSIDIDTLEYEQLFPEIIKELPNGDMVVAGYYSSNYLGIYVGLVSKINQEGIPYWERKYTATTDIYDDNIIYDLDFTDDGGIILAGSAFGNEALEGQNFWALKLDSLGCLIPGCDTLDIGVMNWMPDQSNIQIYPNPMSKVGIVILDSPNISSDSNLFYVISDFTGKVIAEENVNPDLIKIEPNRITFQISHTCLTQGIFLLSIYNDSGSLGSVKVMCF